MVAPHMGLRIRVDSARLAEFCQRHAIRRLAFFGSVLRDDFRPDSDVDVLVEFEPGKMPGYAFFDIQEELSRLLGRRADMHAPDALNEYIRDRVLREAEGVYDAA
ncbi:MAG TPA: nucleotidyltransferase family protein [Candidatus Thermoplasmatota archaeon]